LLLFLATEVVPGGATGAAKAFIYGDVRDILHPPDNASERQIVASASAAPRSAVDKIRALHHPP
jgi:hypothetical protein